MKSVAAAFVFFTRLPFWRKVDISGEDFSRIIPYWPLTGWVTGGLSALVLLYGSYMFPVEVAVIVALCVRLLLTGALHEDGLADFFDGFGGGTSRERILAIMKDSHIGTYGVISLIFYFLLSVLLLSSLPLSLRCALLFAADPLAKGITGAVVNLLPYARTAEQSKSGTVYTKMPLSKLVLSFVFALLPVFIFMPLYAYGIIITVLVFFALVIMLKNKIGGYTGDCCGAVMLLCELSFYLMTILIYTQWR